ncbi:hypothetical protein [Gottfriedia acidiceleris]|uniref:Endonuclease/exonuclease/phosphatase domain-containing protein n=1 Tax=Gottfriedia acidiceleris TaxID=371036 RepID=A0ABY4JLQ0_9BACI|nr:hypothetical protein [Gottfriedia acidiceleris]UPM53657.1 hypothetical protein MY490_18020 [Gottfriedia acidiceleris]
MKILSWNCRRGLLSIEKYEKLLGVGSDIAVIPECVHPSKIQNTKHFDSVWKGKEGGIGLGIFSFSNDYQFSLLEDKIKYEWFIPIKVTGKTDFILIAVWMIRTPGYSSYGKLLYTALMEYEHLLKNERVIIIGDFNIDKKLATSYSGISRGQGFEKIIDIFSRYNIESCYHSLNHEEYGRESKATYYHYNHADKPFHIDYCFVNEELLQNVTKFTIGDYEEWHRYSDHSPIIVDIL